MWQFVDAVGPLVVIVLAIVAVYLVYLLLLSAATKTREAWLELERQAIANRIAADNGRLVTVTQQAALVARQHVESGVLYGEVFDLLRADVDSRRLPQPVPHHYAPHIIDRRPVAELPAPVEEGQAVAVPAQDIWQLWTAGLLPDNGFLMGHDLTTGEPVLADWLQLYSALVGGMSGSGKSTLIRSVLIQSALQGGRFVVLDRHYGAGEESLGASLQPLRPLMLCDVAANERQMVDALRWVLDIGRKRLSGQDANDWPLILVVEETTAMFQRSNIVTDLATVLGEIAQETRKKHVYALCIGQNFDGKIMPTTIRNSFASFISCRARRDVARVMSGDNEFGKMAAELRVGQAVWMSTNGDVTRLAVPNATQKHIELVARQCLPGVSAESNSGYPQRESGDFATYAVTTVESAGNQPGIQTLDARALRAIEMFEAGATQAEIIPAVWDNPAKGRPYQSAANEFQNIIREYIRQLRGN
jgi:hypothetical protein